MGWPMAGGTGSPEDIAVRCYETHNTQPVVVDLGIMVNMGVHSGSWVAGRGAFYAEYLDRAIMLRYGPSVFGWYRCPIVARYVREHIYTHVLGTCNASVWAKAGC